MALPDLPVVRTAVAGRKTRNRCLVLMTPSGVSGQAKPELVSVSGG